MTPSLNDLAESVLDQVRAASPGAEAEVVVDRSELALTRFAQSFIHQNVADATTTVRLRLHDAGRTASASAAVTDEDGLRGLVDRTVAAVRVCPPDPRWPGLTAPTPVPAAVPIDEATAYAEPPARAERVRAFVAAAGSLETAGYCSTVHHWIAFANSAGQSAQAQTAEAAMDAIARRGTADGVARLAAPRLADLDGAVLGARAAAKANAGTDPIELPPGRYEVVLEPTAVNDLIDFIASYGFNAKSVAQQESFVELDRAQFDPALSLVDDPLATAAPGLPFDVEGTPKHPLTLVSAGVSSALAHDRRTAARAGRASTGHALPGATSAGASPTNLHLLPDTARPARSGEAEGPAADADVADLVAGVGRGLLVTDFWYTRVLDQRSLVVTGLTRNGVWLIEDGRVVAPVQNLRFTQSYPAALAPGAVLGVGTRSVALPYSWGVMTFRVPALRLASWKCTGNASG
jgi:predicted Zn-dependent protease